MTDPNLKSKSLNRTLRRERNQKLLAPQSKLLIQPRESLSIKGTKQETQVLSSRKIKAKARAEREVKVWICPKASTRKTQTKSNQLRRKLRSLQRKTKRYRRRSSRKTIL